MQVVFVFAVIVDVLISVDLVFRNLFTGVSLYIIVVVDFVLEGVWNVDSSHICVCVNLI